MTLSADLETVRAELAEVTAERDDLNRECNRLANNENQLFQVLSAAESERNFLRTVVLALVAPEAEVSDDLR